MELYTQRHCRGKVFSSAKWCQLNNYYDSSSLIDDICSNNVKYSNGNEKDSIKILYFVGRKASNAELGIRRRSTTDASGVVENVRTTCIVWRVVLSVFPLVWQIRVLVPNFSEPNLWWMMEIICVTNLLQSLSPGEMFQSCQFFWRTGCSSFVCLTTLKY